MNGVQKDCLYYKERLNKHMSSYGTLIFEGVNIATCDASINTEHNQLRLWDFTQILNQEYYNRFRNWCEENFGKIAVYNSRDLGYWYLDSVNPQNGEKKSTLSEYIYKECRPQYEKKMYADDIYFSYAEIKRKWNGEDV